MSLSGSRSRNGRFVPLLSAADGLQSSSLDIAALRRLALQAQLYHYANRSPTFGPSAASSAASFSASSASLLSSSSASSSASSSSSSSHPTLSRSRHSGGANGSSGSMMASAGPSSSPVHLASSSAADSVGLSKKDDESNHFQPLLSVATDSGAADSLAAAHQQSHSLRARFSAQPSSSAFSLSSRPGPLSALLSSSSLSSSSPSLAQLQAAALVPNPLAHSQFTALLHEELSKVNGIVLGRLSELRAAFTSLETQAARLSKPEGEEGGAGEGEDDALLDPVKAGYVELYRQCMQLQSFAVSHASVFASIIRQYALFTAAERERLVAVTDEMELRHNRDMMELVQHVETVYAELWGLDSSIALTAGATGETPRRQLQHSPPSPTYAAALHSPTFLLRAQARALLFTHQHQPTSWSTFDRGLRFGITLLLFFWVLWDCVVDARLRPLYPVEWVQSVLPVYRGIGVLLLLEWGWGCNLYIWERFRINYLQLLELDPRSAMNYTQVFDEATTASMAFLANFLLYFKILRGDFPPWIPAGYFPTAIFLYMLYKLLPWRGRRSVIWSALAQVVLSPFGRVCFLTTYTGDILTSLVKPIVDWAYTVCFLLTLEWVDDAVNDEVCFNNKLFNSVVVPLLSALPLWFRFMQCLRRYMDSRKRWPHLANAGKYALSHSVVLFGVFHTSFKDSTSGDTYRTYWIVSLVISSLYSYCWDIWMDFGLGSLKHGGLREQLMYGNKAVYYVSMVADLFLRFAWSLTLVPRGEHAPFSPSVIIYLQPLLAMAEVTRRCMWGALRLEWEHIGVLGFKKMEGVGVGGVGGVMVGGGVVPGASSSAVASEGRSGFSIILEVAVITLMVLSVGLVAALTAN